MSVDVRPAPKAIRAVRTIDSEEVATAADALVRYSSEGPSEDHGRAMSLFCFAASMHREEGLSYEQAAEFLSIVDALKSSQDWRIQSIARHLADLVTTTKREFA